MFQDLLPDDGVMTPEHHQDQAPPGAEQPPPLQGPQVREVVLGVVVHQDQVQTPLLLPLVAMERPPQPSDGLG